MFTRDELKKMHIGVIMGGLSTEREISLKSGEAIISALINNGYQATAIDMDQDIPKRLKEEGIDIAFITLHGRYGEDGCVQGLLEIMQIPYTGSGVLASALGMNKLLSKKSFESNGIRVPPYHAFNKERFDPKDLEEIKLSTPFVVKPISQGSSIGVEIIDRKDLRQAITRVFNYDPLTIVEEYIEGMEVSVGILGEDAIGALEVVPHDSFASYETKNIPGREDFFIPPRVSREILKEVIAVGLKAHQALGCEGYSRVDLRVNNKGEGFVLEVNTIPGMTNISWLPRIAQSNGIDYDELVERILQTASLKS